MTLQRISQVTGTAVVVPGDDMDTDQILPASFMRCVTFDGLGEKLFHDARYDAQGRSKGHPLDQPERRGAAILVSGSNFGCGSSREHAPQALHKFGIRAVVAGSFAEIFFGNCTTLGLPCVSLKKKDLDKLSKAVLKDPRTTVVVDLAALAVTFGSQRVACTLKEGARQALLAGQWDAISLLLEGQAEVARLEAALPRPQAAAPAPQPQPAPASPPAGDAAWLRDVHPALPSLGEVF